MRKCVESGEDVRGREINAHCIGAKAMHLQGDIKTILAYLASRLFLRMKINLSPEMRLL